jgi:hypothetical protein
MKYKTKQTIFSALAFLIILGGTILAGSLIPTGPVGTPTMYTLSDIYNKLTIPSYTSTPTHSVSTTSLPTTGTMNTLSEIWSAIPSYLTGDTSNATSTRSGTTLTLTIPRGISDGTATLSTTSAGLIEGNIKKDVNIFGVVGNYEGAGAPTLTWDTADITQFNCSWFTNLAGTPLSAEDPATLCNYQQKYDAGWNLVPVCAWNAGASTCDGVSPDPQTGQTYITWYAGVLACYNSVAQSQSVGTWRLPTYSELVAEYLATNPGNTSSFQDSNTYWSSNENPIDSDLAYDVSMNNGNGYITNKNIPGIHARCDR